MGIYISFLIEDISKYSVYNNNESVINPRWPTIWLPTPWGTSSTKLYLTIVLECYFIVENMSFMLNLRSELLPYDTNEYTFHIFNMADNMATKIMEFMSNNTVK